MLVNFFHELRQAKIPVTVKELLVLIEALEKNLAFGSIDEFYLLARTCLIKDEKHFDRFDKAFSLYFNGLENLGDIIDSLIPDEWTRTAFLKNLSNEEKEKIKSLGGLNRLIDEFKKRLKEQQKRHQGGNKWIGTGGTSPFGNNGYHPEGIRVGGEGTHKRAVKVWEKREFKNLDDSVELGTRNIKVALRKLRKFARTGAHEELDLENTIRSTANNAGFLDLKMVKERHNAVKVLLFFDIGGSMDPYIQLCEELFSACKSEFKHIENFYFHNFIYDFVWKNNQRRHSETTALYDVLNTYSSDYKVIFVGDASMAPYEIASPFGSVEYNNQESGAVWMQRLTSTFSKVIWLNPTPERFWDDIASIKLTRELVEERMYSLTLDGLEKGIEFLSQ